MIFNFFIIIIIFFSFSFIIIYFFDFEGSKYIITICTCNLPIYLLKCTPRHFAAPPPPPARRLKKERILFFKLNLF